MNQFINNISDIFEEIAISFEDSKIGERLGELPIQESAFGILNFKAKKTEISTKPQDFVFNIDNSGSMSDSCSDGRNKMRHITFTLKNMLHYFNDNPSINANITIFTFNDTVSKIVERTCINSENILEIISMIDKIRPVSSTNIEDALRNAKEYIAELKQLYPDNEISHIFMTDGDATSGSKDHAVIKQQVDRSVMNAFIGFGIEHDACLLNSIGGDTNCSYHFIDKLETSGFVYGEILHGILYKYLKNVCLDIRDGLIYNYKSNLWTDKLAIGDIIGDSNKTYHIISDNPYDCIITITGTPHMSENEIEYQMVVFFDENEHNEKNNKKLTKYIFRHRTLQLLFEVNEFETDEPFKNSTNDNHEFNFNLRINNTDDEMSVKKRNLKNKLHAFIIEMKKYMSENNLVDDCFLKNLCDDAYISYRTIGSKYGKMYTSARQTSQGTQRCYSVTNPPILRRQVAYDPTIDTENTFDSFDSFDYNNDLFHEISNFTDTPYSITQATQVMCAVSGNIRDNDTDTQPL
jgi:uncharacterized protein YegL